MRLFEGSYDEEPLRWTTVLVWRKRCWGLDGFRILELRRGRNEHGAAVRANELLDQLIAGWWSAGWRTGPRMTTTTRTGDSPAWVHGSYGTLINCAEPA
ncbi:MAG TPA: hypothetical protein VK988_02660 [Acidimicrobiales bacterium]|nr:hypothetical protein [Acidimicrobiales bacterium]